MSPCCPHDIIYVTGGYLLFIFAHFFLLVYCVDISRQNPKKILVVRNFISGKKVHFPLFFVTSPLPQGLREVFSIVRVDSTSPIEALEGVGLRRAYPLCSCPAVLPTDEKFSVILGNRTRDPTCLCTESAHLCCAAKWWVGVCWCAFSHPPHTTPLILSSISFS